MHFPKIHSVIHNCFVILYISAKHNNILLSKNVYTYPENLACHKCNHVYPRVTENCIASNMVDNNDIKSEPQTKTR